MQTPFQLAPTSPLADALAAAFEATLVDARRHADHAIDSPHASLRGYRVALRRADALLDLCAPCLRKRQRAWLTESVAQARRKTRLLRDLDAVGAVVDDLEAIETATAADASETAPDASRYASVRALINAFRGELATTELVAWRLRKNLRSLAGLSSVFRAALSWVDDNVLLAVVREHYRATRKAMNNAAREGTAPALNAFRREARTLHHQLALLASAPNASDDLKQAVNDVRQVFEQLNALNDIFALRVMVVSADKATLGQSPKKLVAKLDALARSRTTEIFSLAAITFGVRPKDFLATASDDAENEGAALPAHPDDFAPGDTSTPDDAPESDGVGDDDPHDD